MIRWLVLVSILHITIGAEILAVFPIPAKSHNIVFTALTNELARRGHHVTVISPYPQKSPVPNLKDIEVKISLNTENFSPFEAGKMGTFGHSMVLWNEGTATCETFLQHPEVQELIHAKDKHFDLVIIEGFSNECFLGFAHKYKAPIVQICPFGGSHWMNDWVGNPNPYASIPEAFRSYSSHMTLWERIMNTLDGLYWRLGYQLYHIPKQDAAMRKFFTGSDVPPVLDLVFNTSLFLVNNHFSLNYPMPMVPNLVQVGGMHIKPPKKLPQDLQKFLDEAKDGVVYFSMGSILQGSDVPESKRKALLEAFSKLKQKVLWKWETDSLPGQPNNVKLGKWLPQSDILAHPNVRVFITHGGLLGMEEAVTYGIPLIGIPMFGDQPFNVKKMESAEIGVLLDFPNITTESVSWALETVLQPRYRENARRVSQIYKDQPLKPLDLAVYWTEYVIRHKGAPHMRSAALDLTWYQYFLLDVIAVLAIAISSVFLVGFLVLKTLCKKICGKSSKVKSGDKSKKKRN